MAKSHAPQMSSRRGWIIIAAIVIVAVVAIIAAFVWRSSTVSQEAIDDVSPDAGSSTEQSIADEPVVPEPDTQPSQQPSSSVQTTEQSPNSIGQGRGVYGSEPLRDSTQEEVIGAAREFATVFLESGFTSNDDMRAAVRPLMTEGLSKSFEDVEWYNVPNLQLDGRVEIFSVGTSDALVDVFLVRGGVMRVYLVNQDGWKVDDYGIR